MIHVRTWSGSGSGTVTDMTNAGKRGKKCRTLRLSGAPWPEWNASSEAAKLASQFTMRAVRWLEKIGPDIAFDVVDKDAADMEAEARAAGVPEGYFRFWREETRGVDAPRECLTAGVEGKWGASADEKGISLSDYQDVNQWRECTFNQTPAKAYDIARKVWDKVKAAATLHEASMILRDAGARLHSWCGLD